MVFASPTFVFAFLPSVLLLHAVCPDRFRNTLLLAASLLFYAWGEVDAFLLLIATTALNFVVARSLPGRPRLLAVVIALNLAPLLWFKYAAFFAEIVLGADAAGGGPSTLPLGISFYTFQSISFLVDVYREPAIFRRSLIDLFFYTTFFPGMVAGPIERYQDISPQLSPRGVTVDDLSAGLVLFVRGLARKLLIANTLAAPVDEFFALDASAMTTSFAWLAMACYAAQIYFDFGGYSDMALGLARMFGFHYPQNFDRPYTATSVSMFWRRWHISLSRWFRDYVYIPLGGNQRGEVRTYVHLTVVFLLCGLWHGAAWTFVLWGAWHGLALVVERAWLGRLLALAPRALSWGYTMLVVTAGWVLFRADDVDEAAHVFIALAGGGASGAPVAGAESWLSPHLVVTLAIAWVAASVPESAVDAVAERLRRWRLTSALVVVAVIAGVLLCSLALAARTHNPFIYYRF